jgi:uncharacterized protein YcsI (UPF0317 family)
MVMFPRIERVARVATAYTAAHSDPITFAPGDVLRLGARDMEWPEFTWCTAPNGTSGWVHDSFYVRHGRTGVASLRYSAKELTVERGDVLMIQDERGGWSWCRNQQGAYGWIPDTHLEK